MFVLALHETRGPFPTRSPILGNTAPKPERSPIVLGSFLSRIVPAYLWERMPRNRDRLIEKVYRLEPQDFMTCDSTVDFVVRDRPVVLRRAAVTDDDNERGCVQSSKPPPQITVCPLI